jgi:hypothetical protein
VAVVDPDGTLREDQLDDVLADELHALVGALAGAAAEQGRHPASPIVGDTP